MLYDKIGAADQLTQKVELEKLAMLWQKKWDLTTHHTQIVTPAELWNVKSKPWWVFSENTGEWPSDLGERFLSNTTLLAAKGKINNFCISKVSLTLSLH